MMYLIPSKHNMKIAVSTALALLPEGAKHEFYRASIIGVNRCSEESREELQGCVAYRIECVEFDEEGNGIYHIYLAKKKPKFKRVP